VIPSSVAGLLLFVVLLAPGLAYVLRHERVVPARSHSPFRESLRIVFVSVACLLATGLIATALRSALPKHTPNVRGLVIDPLEYWRGHHVELAWWALAFILFATLLGATAADRRAVRLGRWLGGKRPITWVTGATNTDISSVSAWYKVMHIYDDDRPGPILVGAAMDDGTYVEGWVMFFNIAADEDEDREILLGAPLHLTTQDGRRHAYAAQFTVISARHIVRLDVSHVDPDPAAPTLAPTCSPAATTDR
jgi:hypothetical protein